jgi:pimeloyl-ACP methyl ester carboxylesterase
MNKISQPLVCIILFVSATTHAFSQSSKTNKVSTFIDTSFLVPINGVEQYLEIKGASTKNPVLLFIHGGPFWPLTPFIRTYNQNLTKDFIVVSWAQRNCGKSKWDTTKELSLALFVEDAHQVTQFLQKFFRAPKLLVAAHSWGSLIGIKLMKKYPNDYTAYIGMGQVVNFIKSESKAIMYYEHLAEQAGDTATLNTLKAIPFSMQGGYKNGINDLIKFRNAAEKYEFSEIDTTKPNPLKQFNDYTLAQMMEPFNRADEKTSAAMYKMGSTDLSADTVFNVPMFFCVGKHDYVTSFELVQQYFSTIKSPKKELFWFANSGHAPNWEEPNLFYERLLEINKKFENK